MSAENCAAGGIGPTRTLPDDGERSAENGTGRAVVLFEEDLLDRMKVCTRIDVSLLSTRKASCGLFHRDARGA